MAEMPARSNDTNMQTTAKVDGEIHQCVKRRAEGTSVPAFYTLCGILVPPHNVERGSARVSCPKCRQEAAQEPIT
jgi:hypothetical protein